jgi:hypothetical protein
MGVEHDYNQFTGISNLPYNIIGKVLTTNENIWKLLKYPGNDALSKTNLTLAEKRVMMYKGEEITTTSPYRVFTVRFVDDAFELEQTQLRVYIGRISPSNSVRGKVDFGIDVMCHNKIAILNTYQNRCDVLFEEIMKTLNGKEIGGLGNLYFNVDASSTNVANLSYFNEWYQGYRIVMSTNYG